MACIYYFKLFYLHIIDAQVKEENVHKLHEKSTIFFMVTQLPSLHFKIAQFHRKIKGLNYSLDII